MKKLLLISIALFALILSALPVSADSTGRQAVIYYNEACDECATYINGELQEILQSNQVEMVRKDYINQRENRKELNQKNEALGVPLELQSHLVTFIDESRIVLQGEPPRHVVEGLLSAQDLPDRILIYSEEGDGDGYKAWAFNGPVQSYGASEPITTYLNWYKTNQESFANTGITSSTSRLLPAVLLTGLVDGINPCAMAILLFFITFLFTIRKARAAIARMGLVYIACVYIVYFLVGLGLLRATSLVQGHWLGQVGAGLLILFGLTNLLGAIFPKFPIRLELPEIGKEGLKNWMYRATLPATIVLGTFMGLESFPCSGGPYVAILGLLGSQTDFWEGFGYLALYNLMFIMPLVIILILALNPVMGAKIQAWERASSHKVRGITGGVMALIGIILLIWVL
ncbi:MAG: cytochrome c biogenesis CcdA family protein [Chloroflexi bacterium]|nr:cytochrome c biogenesis CcdA family protein [Chloroflexota bacterium]